jgi:hypothetical protein
MLVAKFAPAHIPIVNIIFFYKHNYIYPILTLRL